MSIINLTQHAATESQRAAGVRDIAHICPNVSKLLTFDSLPTGQEILDRAIALAQLADEEFLRHAGAEAYEYANGSDESGDIAARALRGGEAAYRDGADERRRVAASRGDDYDTLPTAMIGGAPYLMGPLAAALLARGIRPVYAFSTRESVEKTDASGAVQKVAVFRHLGFVEAAKFCTGGRPCGCACCT